MFPFAGHCPLVFLRGQGDFRDQSQDTTPGKELIETLIFNSSQEQSNSILPHPGINPWYYAPPGNRSMVFTKVQSNGICHGTGGILSRCRVYFAQVRSYGILLR